MWNGYGMKEKRKRKSLKRALRAKKVSFDNNASTKDLEKKLRMVGGEPVKINWGKY